MNVLESEGACSRFLENCTANAGICAFVCPIFLMLSVIGLFESYSTYFLRMGSCRFHFSCALVIYLFHTHNIRSCSFCLLFSYEMILGRFHLRNNMDHKHTREDDPNIARSSVVS